MTIRTLVVGPLACNCYVVARGGQCAVLDPGGDEDLILNAIERTGLPLTHILNTHGHADHIAANAALKARFPEAQIAIHADDAPMLASPAKNLSLFLGHGVKSPEADLLLEPGQEVDGLGLRILHTPGHTPGSVSFHLADERDPVVFTGDALFAGSVGRTDFPGGDMDTLLNSIRNVLLKLPGPTRVLSGHGPETTLGAEAASNPFL